MSEIGRIRDQLRRVFQGEAWHGPALLELREDVTAKQAATKPLPNAHSIWEIALHLTATHHLVLGRLQGESVVLTREEDWPSVGEISEEAWRAAVDALRRSHAELDEALGLLDETELDRPIVEGFSSRYVTLHGVAQHNTYHAGQIALLKKQQSAAVQ